MAIYTKKGDKGTTALYHQNSGQATRVSKNTQIVRTLGAIDELNSYLGIAVTLGNVKTKKILENLQRNLFTINSIIAGADIEFTQKPTREIEKLIDGLEGKLPPLSNFILSGGSTLAAHLQYARALARRAERETVALSELQEIHPPLLKYMNRLSDLLFMLSREANANKGIKDTFWKLAR